MGGEVDEEFGGGVWIKSKRVSSHPWWASIGFCEWYNRGKVGPGGRRGKGGIVIFNCEVYRDGGDFPLKWERVVGNL